MTPQRGEKFSLVQNALNNAKEALGRKLALNITQKKLLKDLAGIFKLTKVPRRIEVYDNSHIQGTNAVGAMIVAGEEGFNKKQYRTFNIKSENIVAGDDFAMMKEVLNRRFKRLKNMLTDNEDNKINKIEESDFPLWPDLIIIDGGRGQLSAVSGQLEKFDLPHKIELIAIAKGKNRNWGEEKFYMPNGREIKLAANEPILYFLQNLRDEAHRFAIGTHKAKRKKNMVKNPLDEIVGIGAAKKRALLNYFGSAKAVSRASLADLKKVNLISDNLAQKIYDYFNQ